MLESKERPRAHPHRGHRAVQRAQEKQWQQRPKLLDLTKATWDLVFPSPLWFTETPILHLVQEVWC